MGTRLDRDSITGSHDSDPITAITELSPRNKGSLFMMSPYV